MADLTPKERNVLSIIDESNDPSQLQRFIEAGRREGSEVVQRAAFNRLCLIQPEATPGTVEHDVWQSIHALEQMLLEERGKTVRLSRTRQKIDKDGEAKTVADLTIRPEASQGFFDLLERGHPELTFEAVVLRHPKTFDAEIQEAAARRFSAAGLDPSAFQETKET